MTTRLEKIYKEEVAPALMKRFGYTNPMQVPKITKITLNMGVGEAAANKKVLENAMADMARSSKLRRRWNCGWPRARPEAPPTMTNTGSSATTWSSSSPRRVPKGSS